VADTETAGRTVPGHYGATATSGLALCETTIALAWNVQGDPGRPTLAAAAHRLFGVALPTAPNTVARGTMWTALWLGPASWLLVPARGPQLPPAFATAREEFNAAGGALFDVSTARAGWLIAGSQAATVLAKGCPLDFHSRAFPSGSCAQSLFGHVDALFCRHADNAFTLLVARSLAHDVWHTLTAAGAQYGYDVLAPRPFPR